MKKYLAVFITFLFSFGMIFAAENILILSSDVRLVQDKEGDFDSAGGYHLYIRKKSGIESVMLVETTKDPAGKTDNYAYRALEYNKINGDEIRYLDGKVLNSKYSQYSLIDSTPEKDPVFGMAFHIYIPSEIAYGYPWTRNGTVKINRGTFINIRSFAKKYGDYTGDYADNPFMFDFGKAVTKSKPVTPPVPPAPEEKVIVLTDNYNSVAAEKFKEIADCANGEMYFCKGPEALPEDIMKSLDKISPKKDADIVFVIDTTGSMKDDMQQLKDEWIPQMVEKVKDFENLRIGLVLYRDYGDTYKYWDLPIRRYDFTSDVNVLKKHIDEVKILGKEGGDIPEAVYEGLYAALKLYAWNENAVRKIILIGDAEPHPRPRGLGKYTKELITELAGKNGVTKGGISIDTIIVPDDKEDRGR